MASKDDFPALRLDGVTVTTDSLRRVRLDPVSGESRTVLERISLEVPRGRVFSILGESGGGKSTLLRCINRLVEPDRGSVEVLGRNVATWEIRELRRRAVYVPQRSFLFGGSVRDELLRALSWNRLPEIKQALGEALERVHLQGVGLDTPASELSEGQRLRLCLARAMLLRPEILLLDEPTGALDVRTSREMLGALVTWAAELQNTLIVVTHRPEDLEALGGDAAILLGGRIAGFHTAAEVLTGQVGPEVAQFLGAAKEEE